MGHMYVKVSKAGETTEWRPIVGKQKPDGSYIQRVEDSGLPKHYNDNANIAPATVAFAGVTSYILIENIHNANNVLVSFDGDVNTKTIKPNTKLEIRASITELRISANVDATPYEILTLE